MYIYEKRALKRCQHVILRDLNPNITILSQLVKCRVINQEQRRQILGKQTRDERIMLLLDILPHQEDGTCLKLIDILKTDYPWISTHLHREFLKEKTGFTRSFNQDLSTVVTKQISPMVLGPEADECPLPKTSKESLACVETVSDLLDNLQTVSYKHLNVDPLDVCNMALCVALEEKIIHYKKSIDNLQEKITKLRVPENNIRILKQEILNQKEAAKQLDKQIEIKDSAISHLQYQRAVLNQKVGALKRLNENESLSASCKSHCNRQRFSSFSHRLFKENG